MKNRIISVFIPLLLASSLCYTADDVQQTQKQMNVFKSAIKKFQKKMNLYVRCVKRECSQAEKDQALSDVKKTAKIAIPAAIGLITAMAIYKYRHPLKLIKTFVIDPKLQKLKEKFTGTTEKERIQAIEIAKKVETAIVETAINDNNIKLLTQLLKEKKLDPNDPNTAIERAIEIPFLFTAIIQNKPEIIDLFVQYGGNLTKKFNTRLGYYDSLQIALKSGTPELAKHLLKNYKFSIEGYNPISPDNPIILLLRRGPKQDWDNVKKLFFEQYKSALPKFLTGITEGLMPQHVRDSYKRPLENLGYLPEEWKD